MEKFGYAVTAKNRLKYRLWKEQKGKDIYTQETLKITDLAACDIDHIIPQTAGGTNSSCNLVLTTANNIKGDTFAYDFIQEKFPERWEAIKKDMEEMPKNKAWRFTAEAKKRYAVYGDETDEDYADRRLQDTRYMSKVALRYLACIYKKEKIEEKILPIRGGMTAQLRHLWGFDGIEYELMGLNVPKDTINKETGEVNINPDWEAKPRIDHRHHAVDAMVLCAITRSLAQKMYKADNRNKKLDASIVDMPFRKVPQNPKLLSFRELALAMLKTIKISHKPEHATNTRLHKETAIRVLSYDENDQLYIANYMRSLGNIDSFSKLEGIAVAEKLGTDSKVQKMRERCAHIIKAVNAQRFAAEESLKQKNADSPALAGKEIPEQALVQEAIRLANVGNKYPRLEKFSLVNIREKQQCGYASGSNHRVDFFVYTEGKNKGKIGWECIKSIDAAIEPKKDNSIKFKPKWQEYGKLLWSVCKGDILELHFDKETLQRENIPLAFVTQNEQQEYCMLAKVSEFGNTYMVIISAFDARADQKNALKVNPESFIRWESGNCGLSFYCKAKARKVCISPFGKVKQKLQKLWYGKKV